MTIEANVREGFNKIYTSTVYQHDRGVKLSITGIELPSKYEVHFSNQESGGVSYAVKGKSDGVLIPDAYFSTGDYVYAWVYGVEDNAGRSTVIEIIIPVAPRPMPLEVQETSTSESGGFPEFTIDGENMIFKKSGDNDEGDSTKPDEPSDEPQGDRYSVDGENLIFNNWTVFGGN